MFSERIKQYRSHRQLTQEQLAKTSGVTYATLIKLESGANTNPTLKTLQKLSKALRVQLISLLK